VENFFQLLNIINKLINDKNIPKKLKNREKWLESNKNRILSKIFNILQNN